MPRTPAEQTRIVDAEWAESEQVMIDQFFDLCDAALVAARHGLPRAVRLIDAARRLGGWFPQWLADDLEIDDYLNRLQVVADLWKGAGTTQPAA